MPKRGGNTKLIKELMYQKYGKRCMICGWKPKSNNKKSKKRCLTYHHIIEYSKGGETSIENGAILCTQCHEWLNSLSSYQQKYVNIKLQIIKFHSARF